MKLFTQLNKSDQDEMQYELSKLVSDLGWFKIQSEPSSYYTYVAGISYGNRIQNLRTLKEGDAVFLIREPQNPHDPNAVKVLSLEYLEIGYVPRDIAVSISKILDDLGGEQKATVSRITGSLDKRSKLDLTISFTLPAVAWSEIDRNSPKFQTPVLRSFHEVSSGHLGADEMGRFFVMEITHQHAIAHYENQEKSRLFILSQLGRLLPLWPFTQRDTIQSIKDGLREFGISPSGDIFLDHETLKSIERKSGNHKQLTRIRYSAPYRSKVLAMRKMIPSDLSTDSFYFGSPPPVFSYSDHQIQHAASRLKTASVLILTGTVIVISVLLLNVASYMCGGGLFSRFSERPLFTIMMIPLLVGSMVTIQVFKKS